MKLWHVTYTCFGFFCHAVVVHESRGAAVVLLDLDRECRSVEVCQIGIAFSESPYIVCDDRIELTAEKSDERRASFATS